MARLKKALKKLARRAAPARKSTLRKANGAGQHETQHAVEQFLYRQAELLDAKQWEGYLDLALGRAVAHVVECHDALP